MVICRVKQAKEDLFGNTLTLGDLQPFDKYQACVCIKPEIPGGPLDSEIPCIKDSVAQCSAGNDIIGTGSCAPAGQTRRSVRNRRNAPYIPAVRIDNDVPRWKREVTEEKNWTEAEAEAFCQEFMGRSVTFNLCGEVPNVRPQTSVENCVMDLMLTGDTSWSDISLEAMQSGCLQELQRNTTLRKTTTEDEISLAEKIEEKACPKNCSGVGTCDKGKCLCSSGWGGYDCSIDLTVGPTIHGLLDNGFCDEQEFTCDHAYVFGQIFTKSPNLTCRLEEFSLSEDGTRLPRGSHSFPGQFETMIEVICPLQPTRRRRSVPDDEFVLGFTISVSNDGHLYEPGKDLFIYDSECQNVQNISGQMHFTLKEGYCFIENRCVYGGGRSPSTNCSFCNPTESTRTWSTDTQIPGCFSLTSPTSQPRIEPQSQAKTTQYLWIIGVVAGTLLGIAVGAVVIFKLTKGRAKKVGDSTIFIGGAEADSSTTNK